jgi:hypothetical protein
MGEAPQARFVLKQGTRIDERELREFAGEPRALQGVPPVYLRQRATQNCDWKDSKIRFGSTTPRDRLAVGQSRMLNVQTRPQFAVSMMPMFCIA